MADTKNTAKPSLDLSSLVPVAAEVPKVARERKHKDNPFVAWLAASYENDGAGQSVNVPDENVGEIEYLIRLAAQDLGIGSRVVKQPAEDEKGKAIKGQTTIIYAGKDRKVRKADADTAEPTA